MGLDDIFELTDELSPIIDRLLSNETRKVKDVVADYIMYRQILDEIEQDEDFDSYAAADALVSGRQAMIGAMNINAT